MINSHYLCGSRDLDSIFVGCVIDFLFRGNNEVVRMLKDILKQVQDDGDDVQDDGEGVQDNGKDVQDNSKDVQDNSRDIADKHARRGIVSSFRGLSAESIVLKQVFLTFLRHYWDFFQHLLSVGIFYLRQIKEL